LKDRFQNFEKKNIEKNKSKITISTLFAIYF
jgi:hypothetical protein